MSGENWSPQFNDGFYWFPLHSGDFLVRTSMLNAVEIGCYVQLLVYLTRHSHAPTRLKDLKIICKCDDVKAIKKALTLLGKETKGYFSPDIINFKLKAIEISNARSEAGKKGAKKRWGDKDEG